MVDDHRRWAAFAPEHPVGSPLGPKWGAHDLIHRRASGGFQRTAWKVNKLRPEALAHLTPRVRRCPSALCSRKFE